MSSVDQPFDLTAFDLTGRRAVVTGGGTGLGRAITTRLAAAGAEVIIASRRPPENPEELGSRVHHLVHDVTDTAAAADLATHIAEQYGPVEILVNNAGNHVKKPFLDMTVDEFTSVLNVHLTGAFAMTQALAPGMRELGRGSVINLASMTSYIGMPSVVGYSTAKAGVLGLTQSLACELSPFGIRVNAVAPGWIDTPMFRAATDADPQRKAKILDRTPMGRVGTPDDVGHAVVYLCSPAAAFVSGVTLPVDGAALNGF